MYLPGLDGLRAISVLLVVAFHAGVIDGGWIGVDLFFGISGFLITGLLVAEQRTTGRVALGAFWMRRIRRLVPALIILLILIAALVGVHQVDVSAKNIWGAITYSSNWVHIFGGVSYWDHFATPDPLRHLWSLAIEEQFYVLWPIVAWFVLGRRGTSALGKVAIAGAVISAGIQIIGINIGLSVDRVYQGTDTRAVAFLLGAAVATHHWPPRVMTWPAWILPTSILAVLVPAAVGLPGDQRWVFCGPLLLISIAGIAAVHHSSTQPGRLLQSAALRAMGRWSYGIYLFHWPLVITHWLDDVNSVMRFGIVTVLSTALAALSFQTIEAPIRHRRLPRRVLLGAGVAGIFVIGATFSLSTSATPALDVSVTLAPRPIVDSVTGTTLAMTHRIMVFGDSVPAVAAEELDAVARSRGMEIEVRADPGCVPSEDINDQYGKPECVTFLQNTPARAKEIGVDTAIIWWGRTGIGYVEHGISYNFCDANAQQITRARLHRLVAYFAEITRDIILVAPVPRTDIGSPDAAGTACEITAYEDVATELGLTIVPLRDDVCPSYPDDCDRIHRYDGLHYNGDSAKAVAEIIFKAINS